MFNNQFITNLVITILDGKITTLESNQDISEFQSFLYKHESRLYFGEIALVNKSNPIQELDTHFNCIILDENAVCHIAIGNAYSVTCRNFEENIRNDSMNQSDIHIDLMFGSNDLEIEAFKENYKVNLKTIRGYSMENCLKEEEILTFDYFTSTDAFKSWKFYNKESNE